MVSAQALSGMAGTVTDSSGAVVAEAKVMVTNVDTGVESHAVTSSAGTYGIADLIPGLYTVQVAKSGYKSVTIKGVRVEPGGVKSSADAVLSAGSINEVVEVQAPAIALETEDPEIGTTVEHEMIEEVPIEVGNNAGGNTNRGRRIDSFMFLTPGVTGGAFSHRINGGVDFENEVAFNGLPLVKDETPGFQEIVNPPYEMVNEAHIISSVFSTKYGLGQGVTSFQFASGTNALHASAFELMRNSYFDAPGAYSTISADGHKVVPVDHENNFGFSLGGPFYIPKIYNGRNRTFFHFDFEWYRLNQDSTSTGTVPTNLMRSGDFSHNVDDSGNLIPIYVPQSWANNSSLVPAGCNLAALGYVPGQPFPGNKIDPSCFGKISTQILSLMPQTDNPRAPNPNHDNIFAGVTSFPTRERKWGVSIDHNLTINQKIHGSYWRSPYKAYGAGFTFAASNPLLPPGYQTTYGNGAIINYSNMIKKNLVMTAGAFYEQDNNDFSAGAAAFTNRFSSLITNSTAVPRLQFNSNAPNGLTTMGAGGFGGGATIQHGKGFSAADNFIYTAGRHTLNFGVEFRHSTQHIFGQNCDCVGTFNFNSETTSNNDLNTSDPLNVNNTGNAFASFLLGNVDTAFRSHGALTKLRNFAVAPYVQDNIKVTPKFTVDVGLRWDVMVPFTQLSSDPAAQVNFFDPRKPNPGAISTITGQPINGAISLLGTCSYCAGYDRASIRWHNFGPRLGFAYQLNKKTVVRSGYALNYLNGGAYDYGDVKIGNYFTGLLAGFVSPPLYQNTGFPGTGMANWDNGISPVNGRKILPIPDPVAIPFSPSICKGLQSNQCVEFFSKDPGAYPFSHSWNAGLQRELPWNMFFSASYVGNRGVHLPSQLNPLNQLNPRLLSRFGSDLSLSWLDPAAQTDLQSLGFGKDQNGFYSPYQQFFDNYGGVATSATLLTALVPFPQYPNIAYNSIETEGKSRYDAFQVQGQKRFTRGVSFLVNYTLSRAMANAETGFDAFVATPLNKYNLAPEYSIASYDQTHVINISGVYELPVGPGKPLLGNSGALMKNLVGGWQVSAVLRYESGTPLEIGAGGNPLNNGFNRANLIPGVNPVISWGNVDKVDANGNALPVLNPAAFSDPGPWALGNAPRVVNAIRLPFSDNENVALAKKFFLGERVHTELRMEFFNILNRVNRSCSPDTNVSDSNFGLAPQQCQRNSPRQGQAFLRISF